MAPVAAPALSPTTLVRPQPHHLCGPAKDRTVDEGEHHFFVTLSNGQGEHSGGVTNDIMSNNSEPVAPDEVKMLLCQYSH